MDLESVAMVEQFADGGPGEVSGLGVSESRVGQSVYGADKRYACDVPVCFHSRLRYQSIPRQSPHCALHPTIPTYGTIHARQRVIQAYRDSSVVHTLIQYCHSLYTLYAPVYLLCRHSYMQGM